MPRRPNLFLALLVLAFAAARAQVYRRGVTAGG
jgi:hypothetical protein